MNDTRRASDWLLDHATEQASALEKLENVVWYATDLLLEADRIYRTYGPPAAPGDEVAKLVAGIRHYLLIAPPITPAPETGVVGEDAPVSGPHVDIAFTDDIRGAARDLRGDE